MDVTIRSMQAQDYEACHRLWTSDEHIHAGLVNERHDFERYLEHNPGCSQVAVSAAGVIVGAIAAGHDGYRGSCHHLVVEAAYRRHGVARALAQAAFAGLKAQGIKPCFVWIYASNQSGQAFWRRMGFEAWEDCPTWSRRLE